MRAASAATTAAGAPRRRARATSAGRAPTSHIVGGGGGGDPGVQRDDRGQHARSDRWRPRQAPGLRPRARSTGQSSTTDRNPKASAAYRAASTTGTPAVGRSVCTTANCRTANRSAAGRAMSPRSAPRAANVAAARRASPTVATNRSPRIATARCAAAAAAATSAGHSRVERGAARRVRCRLSPVSGVAGPVGGRRRRRRRSRPSGSGRSSSAFSSCARRRISPFVARCRWPSRATSCAACFLSRADSWVAFERISSASFSAARTCSSDRRRAAASTASASRVARVRISADSRSASRSSFSARKPKLSSAGVSTSYCGAGAARPAGVPAGPRVATRAPPARGAARRSPP